MSLQDLEELQQKTEEANAIMELVLETQRQISDDNMRQGKVSTTYLHDVKVYATCVYVIYLHIPFFPGPLPLTYTFEANSLCSQTAAMWQEKLDALEFSKSSMSTESSRALSALATLAIRLGLDDTSLSRLVSRASFSICITPFLIIIILDSYQTALAQLTIDTLEAELEENELDEMEYALRGRIKNAEDELSKMKR